jgi:flagellin
LQLDGSLNASTAATINIGKTVASAATISSGAKTGDGTTAGGIDVSSQTSANSAITTIQNAIETVSTERSKLGAYTNRLEHTIANLGTASENLTSAESRIRDVNMAKEMSTFSKNNILSQAAQAMLAQANQQPQQVLQLLR